MQLQATLVKPRLKTVLSNEIGIISKEILDQINSKLCKILKVNQWKNTTRVINWLKKLNVKVHINF